MYARSIGSLGLTQGQSCMTFINDGLTVVFSNNLAMDNSIRGWQLGNGGAPSTMVLYGNMGSGQYVFTSTNGSTFYVAGNAEGPGNFTADALVIVTNGTWTSGATFEIGRGKNTTQNNNNTGTVV